MQAKIYSQVAERLITLGLTTLGFRKLGNYGKVSKMGGDRA